MNCCSHCGYEWSAGDYENPEEEEEMSREEMEKELLEILAERGREFIGARFPKQKREEPSR